MGARNHEAGKPVHFEMRPEFFEEFASVFHDIMKRCGEANERLGGRYTAAGSVCYKRLPSAGRGRKMPDRNRVRPGGQ